MYKHHFSFASIGARHGVVFVALLILIIGSQNLSAQQQIAQDAYAIFQGSCLICHGPDGAYRETLLMEHAALIDGGTVVPGNPDASELYKRLLGPTDNGARMPLGQEPLPPQSIEAIRNWILAGAPDWASAPATNRPFISHAELLTSIETHLMSLEPFDRAFARYFTLTHLYNAGETVEILREYQKALSKLVNSLSWGSAIINPQPIDLHATIFYIDLRHYEWDRNDAWTTIEGAYPYHISFDAPADLAQRNQLGRLQRHSMSDVPAIHIDWFLAAASTPPLYHELLSLPSTVLELERELDVDVARNIVQAPGVRVWRAGFNNSGVSNHNRVVERHTSRYGAYWKSYDFAGSAGTQNIFTHPLAFTHDGGEIIFNLPNGLQGYYLADGNGIRLNEAPISIVSNPAASDPTVRNGISCIGCHTEGMKTFEDQVRKVIESNANPPYNKAQALRLYVEQSAMDARVNEDMETYRVALEATGGMFSGIEPVSRFHETFQGPVDAAYAAAVFGLKTKSFLQKVRENTGLQNVGLLALEGENGSVKRDTWTSSFRDIISALDYPGQVAETPVITQPDVIPGSHIDIPDPNLRASIAEALGINPNTPITVEEMQALEGLDPDRVINDLTGLQFATNLVHLDLDRSQISDISPLRGLINLKFLEVHGTFSDISPIRGLINLEHLDVAGSNVSDLNPIAGLLINLEVLNIPDNIALPTAVVQNGFIHIPDVNLRLLIEETLGTKAIRPSALETLTSLKASNRGILNLAGLEFAVNLEELWISKNPVSDLSPLAACLNLIGLALWDVPVSDLSPLTNLTNLEWLEIRSPISDISPLNGLTKLKRLVLYGGGERILDISPLAGLINLREITIRHHHEINDLSPFANLINLKEIVIRNAGISDVSPLRQLTKLEVIDFRGANILDISPLKRSTNLRHLDLGGSKISDVSPLAGMPNLAVLRLSGNEISDISPLTGLTHLRELRLSGNNISDVSPLEGLINLKNLLISDNLITDITPLAELSKQANIFLNDNPVFPRGGPKLEGPWLWTWIPSLLHEGRDLLKEATNGAVTELDFATHGAAEGEPGGNSAWTLHELSSTNDNNILELINSLGWTPSEERSNIVLYGCISVYAPREQETNILLGSEDGMIIWLNGEVVGRKTDKWGKPKDYNMLFPVTLKEGKNILFVILDDLNYDSSLAFIGFQHGTEYTVKHPTVGYAFSQTPLHVDDTFTLNIRAENVFNLAGWQFDIAFDPAILEALDVTEGDFLKADSGTTFFQSGRIDNTAGKITGLSAALIADNGVSGSGSILQLRFKAKSEGETKLTLSNFLFGSITEERIPAGPLEVRVAVKERLLTGDVNRDGVVNILDLIRVARQLGQNVPADSAVDVNGDGVVNIFDLTLVAQGIGGAAAPPAHGLDSGTIEAWISLARIVDDGSLAFRQAIANLQNLLASLIPETSALLPNYPNPFNPETWIPYQLASPAKVTLTIYDIHGGTIRRLEMGHQAAGLYRNQHRAAYWDGRNGGGEPIASGVYFYTLSAGDFTATRKMLIRK